MGSRWLGGYGDLLSHVWIRESSEKLGKLNFPDGFGESPTNQNQSRAKAESEQAMTDDAGNSLKPDSESPSVNEFVKIETDEEGKQSVQRNTSLRVETL